MSGSIFNMLYFEWPCSLWRMWLSVLRCVVNPTIDNKTISFYFFIWLSNIYIFAPSVYLKLFLFVFCSYLCYNEVTCQNESFLEVSVFPCNIFHIRSGINPAVVFLIDEGPTTSTNRKMIFLLVCLSCDIGHTVHLGFIFWLHENIYVKIGFCAFYQW